MNILKERTFLVSLLFLLNLSLFGQANPAVIDLTVLTGTQYHIDIQSIRNPIFIEPHPEVFDSLRIDNISSGIKNYRYHYTAGAPDAFSVLVEYYEDGSFPGWDPPKYTRVNIEIVNSTLYPTHDYFTVYKDSGITSLDVLSNDSSSHHPLLIHEIVLTQNGQASSQGDTLINFLPDPGYSGMAYVNYVASNGLGLAANGTVSVCVLDTFNIAVSDTIHLSTTNKNTIALPLPSSEFEVDASNPPNLGSVEFLDGDAIEYNPYSTSDGLDTFLIKTTDLSLERLIIIDVIYVEEDNGFVKDDVVYTSVNTPVTFNVYDNDLKDNGILTSYSSDLTQGAAGIFSYTPPSGFVGVEQFFYTVYNGLEYQTGNITIHVNNYYPEDILVFNLTTPKNTPLVLQYEIPLDTYDFSVLSNPTNGSLTTQDGTGTINTSCEVVNGFNLISYEPGLDYVGEDEFDLEYCIDGAQCEVVKVNVEVLAMDSSCYCSGPKCVWSGDADGSGAVSVADILPVGYHMGAVGTNRTASDPMAWYAQFSDDWGEMLYTGKDAKHADTDGDGIVSASDTVSVANHYDLYHNIVADQSLIIKDFPLSIIPHSTSFDSGDFVLLDIAIGDNQYPVVDLHGLAYKLQIAPEIIDSSSLMVDFRDDLWFGNNSPTLDLYRQPTDGLIEMAFTRTSGYSVTGDGIITTVGFIGDEDLDGFNLADLQGQIPFNVTLTDMIMVDGQGNTFALPDASTIIYLNYDLREPVESLLEENVIVYPNPASDIVRIHVNGKDEMTALVVFDQLGRKINQVDGLDTPDYKLDVSDLPMGMYMLHVVSKKGAVTKKLQIIKTE